MECNKQKTKVPKPNQNSQSEQSKYDKTTSQRECKGKRTKESSLRKNTSDQFLGGSSIQPDWLRRWHEFSRPVP